MHQLYYIFVLFAILFLFENKAINILIAYIGLLISISILLPFFPYVQSLHMGIEGPLLATLSTIEGEYYSYIIILVQVSALTILFGFIIMLFPSLSRSISKRTLPLNISQSDKLEIFKISNLIVIFLVFLIISFSFPYIFTRYDYNISSLLFNSLLYSPTLCDIVSIEDSNDIPLNFIKNYVSLEESPFLRKLGLSLFNNDSTILKLFILTFILLLAIISLFFLIF